MPGDGVDPTAPGLNGERRPPEIVIKFAPNGEPGFTLHGTGPNQIMLAGVWLAVLGVLQIAQVLANQGQAQGPKITPATVMPR